MRENIHRVPALGITLLLSRVLVLAAIGSPQKTADFPLSPRAD